MVPPFVNGEGDAIERFDGDGERGLFYRLPDGKKW